jgi:nicotinate phosphoribosyltransferase
MPCTPNRFQTPPALSLLTDLYELTMAYGFWRQGLGRHEAVFHVTFRSLPFGGGYAIAAGLAEAVAQLECFRFGADECAYLAGLRDAEDRPLLPRDFIAHLHGLRLSCDVDALPEGTLVFPHEPLVRVRGPLLEAQLIETLLLNTLNFQTLVATKAARICLAAQGDPVIDFGLRRAQGIDGGIAASRAAFIGGCESTSNVLAGRLFGIPVKGTHAHSWVMAFPDEPTAFGAYAEALPGNCVLLVDTYDSLEGVRHAIATGRELRRGGHELLGIRLDSGDLAYLSIEARRLLDGAGFPRTAIVASNDLDEHVITSLKLQGAAVSVWGVGTRLVTSYDQPALGGVYKLTAMRAPGATRWEYRMKRSEQLAKVSIPGLLNVRRFRDAGGWAGDMIFSEDAPPSPGGPRLLIDPANATRRKRVDAAAAAVDLLVPVLRGGERVGELPGPREAQARAREQLQALHPGHRRLLNPHEYPAGLELQLHERRAALQGKLPRTRADEGCDAGSGR